ncbi:homoserine kinase [uncultured Ferrovibrio sp.]|jgi:homoserine kinase type II|uniref:homoserine kinase n=1 Tax=uncultured Ferrovibrio sp. TaxID=1576913 RepID=UPI00261421A7|nr:homoserine kinase [uncultured Ferrovibrio sp.]
MAVYTEIDDDQLAALLAEYDIGTALSCKGIAEGVENSNYMLVTDKGHYFLTLYERRVKREDLPYFLGLMDHLTSKGLACPTPIHDRQGNVLREVAGRPCAIISFLNGVWPKRPTTHHCREVGAAMARMHVAGRDFPLNRPNALSVEGWRSVLSACGERANQVREGLEKELEREFDALAAAWPTPPGRAGDKPLPHGVIHADLFPDNVLFVGETLSGLIDFYFACNDYFAYDLAIALNAWCFEGDGAFNVTKAKALIAGYESVRPLTDGEVQTLPLFARGAALRFLLTRLYDWLNQVPGALVKPKDPMEYWKKLKFHRQVLGPSAYGVER